MVILAGGRGTRISPISDSRPKPMLNFKGKPFLELIILQARDFGFSKVLILAGYLGNELAEYFKSKIYANIEIEILISPTELSTKERLEAAKVKLDDFFCLTYGDNLVNFLPEERDNYFKNDENYLKVLGFQGLGYHDIRNLIVSKDSFLLKYENTSISDNPESMLNLGWYLIDKKYLFKSIEMKSSLERILFNTNYGQKIFVQSIKSKYYSVGELNRFAALDRFLDPNRKILILDRDGTVNKKANAGEYVLDYSNFEWREEIVDLLLRLNTSGLEIFILTNQPAVGRQLIAQQEIDLIHSKVYSEFIKLQLNLRGILTCYHGWYDNCDCRKPGVGLFVKLQQIYDINWKYSIYLGDDERDKLAAEKLSLEFIDVSQPIDIVEQQFASWINRKQ